MADSPNLVASVDAVPKAKVDPNLSKLYLEQLVLLILAERLNSLQDSVEKELADLNERQKDVRTLHKVMKAINANTDDKGNFDCTKSPELIDLLNQARELGIDIKEGKTKYTKEERDRLVDNLKMGVEDLNVQNEMKLQKISRLTNERYESYQLARTIMKPLHDDKVNKARAAGGR